MSKKSRRQFHSLLQWGFAASVFIAMSGCRHEKPNVIYMPDMVYSPAIKAQKEGSMRPPVPGTVPMGFEHYPHKMDPDAASRMPNPVPVTPATLQRGKTMYDTYCYVCHGSSGKGDGPVIPKFPKPPGLSSEKVRTWTDGRIYHVITMGQNLMPSYASQIAPADRWAIIHYIRAIQRSENPTPEDLKLLQQESK